MQKKGSFVGWFLLIVVILFIAVPLISGVIESRMKDNEIFDNAKSKCLSLMPDGYYFEDVFCKEINFGRGQGHSMPLIFVLLTFVVITILMYALIEEVPPFKNQVSQGKKGPAAAFTLLISGLISFFTDATKYLTILLIFSGSLILYTVVALFLVFIFIRIITRGHKEGLKITKEHYTGLAQNRKEIRKMELENKNISQDIKLSRELMGELKKISNNDLEELRPIEKLKNILLHLEKIITNVGIIQDSNEKNMVLQEIRRYTPELKKIVHQTKKEFNDENRYKKHLTSIEKMLMQEVNETESELNSLSRLAQKNITQSKRSQKEKSNLSNDLKMMKRKGQEIIETFNTEYIQSKQALGREITQQRNEVNRILDEIDKLIDMIYRGDIPGPNFINNVISQINNLESLIEHSEKILIPELEELDKKTSNKLQDLKAVLNDMKALIEKIA